MKKCLHHVFQNLIEGQEFSIDAFFDKHGSPRLIVPRERLAVRGGEVMASRINMDTNIIDKVKAFRGERLNGSDRILFSGAYWTGNQALKLGLIDGIGDLRTVMREKFGDDVRFKIFDENRSWLQRRFFIKRTLVSDGGRSFAYTNDLIAALEERFWWNRFGL